MSLASNRRLRPALGQTGTASLEFALVALPFFLLMFAGMDLGRYFITRHSLHTLTSEAARSILVNCFNQSAQCNLLPVDKSTVAAKVPFLVSGQITWVNANQSAPAANTGVRTVTVSVTYPFTFVLPAWTGLFASGISETTRIQY
jgi:Flp pilus assembly protein TadG